MSSLYLRHEVNWEHPEGDTVAFAIEARPVSLQGSPSAKKKLRQLVRSQIAGAQFLLSGEVECCITLRVHEKERYEGLFSPDVDNILKPLLDALCGPEGLLVNDCQVQSVKCSWIDWTRTDHSLLFEIRHDSDAWIPKANLVWVEICDKLCMPLNTDVKPAAQEVMLAAWRETFSTRDELLKRGVDYYSALRIMPLQRPFYKARLGGFTVVSLQAMEKRLGVAVGLLRPQERHLSSDHDTGAARRGTVPVAAPHAEAGGTVRLPHQHLHPPR